MTIPDYAVAAKKLEDIRAKQLEASKTLGLVGHQITVGQIWPEAFEGGQKCSAILVGSSTDPRITLKREDGEERTFHLRVVATRGMKGRHMIYEDPNGVVPKEFIDRVQKSNLSVDDRHWIEYNRAREEDAIRMKTLRKGYYGKPS